MGRGPNLSETQTAEIWRLWKSGTKAEDIASAISKDITAIRVVVYASGGIAPRERCRSRLALTLAEREEISRGICAHNSIREIARRIGRAPSSVSREISRNVSQRWYYRAARADAQAWDRALRPKTCRLAENPALAWLVAQQLLSNWSPKQISGWLATEFPGDESMQVSHETIYRSLFIQARGVLKKELIQHLRRAGNVRRAKHYRCSGPGRGRIVDAIPISERPAQADDRAVPGHWEGDLLAGSKNSHIATLVERKSRYVMLAKVPIATQVMADAERLTAAAPPETMAARHIQVL